MEASGESKKLDLEDEDQGEGKDEDEEHAVWRKANTTPLQRW